MSTLTAETLADDSLCIDFWIQAHSLAGLGCILYLCLYVYSIKGTEYFLYCCATQIVWINLLRQAVPLHKTS